MRVACNAQVLTGSGERMRKVRCRSRACGTAILADARSNGYLVPTFNHAAEAVTSVGLGAADRIGRKSCDNHNGRSPQWPNRMAYCTLLQLHMHDGYRHITAILAKRQWCVVRYQRIACNSDTSSANVHHMMHSLCFNLSDNRKLSSMVGVPSGSADCNDLRLHVPRPSWMHICSTSAGCMVTQPSTAQC